MNAHVAPYDFDLLSAVRDFCARAEMSKSRFGELAMNDPSFVGDLEAGREPRQKTIRRTMAFIKAQELEGAAPR